ncbi:hypothetical protein HDU67_003563 [Dinochytrium kinnereticum]|nr:hypothetical protein HDU67_003563 [Dinochytrium kinnereticum]
MLTPPLRRLLSTASRTPPILVLPTPLRPSTPPYYVDTHCHLHITASTLYPHLDALSGIQEMVDRGAFNGMDYCVNVLCRPNEFRGTVGGLKWREMVERFEFMRFAVGVHPYHGRLYNNAVERDIISALAHPKNVALGEIGLDYAKSTVPKDLQKKVFIKQINLAITHQKPLVIHTREADTDTLEILQTYLPHTHPVHVHCFTSSAYLADKLLTHFPNAFLGFTGVVTFHNARNVQEIVRDIVPLDRMLLETDAPFFVPRNLVAEEVEEVMGNGGGRGRAVTRTAHCGMTPYTGLMVAELKGIGVDEVFRVTRENSRAMYGV